MLDALYGAAAGISGWSEALVSLSRETRADGIQLVFVDKKTGRLIRSEQPSSGLDNNVIDGTLEHVREWHHHDPHMVHAAGLPVGKVMNTAESFPIDRYANHPFYREYWSAYGVHALLGAKLAENDQELGMLAITRVHPSPAFNAAEIRLFERYVSHLVRALRITRHIESRHVQAAVGLTMLESSRRPIFLLETDGRVVTKNAAATHLIEVNNAIIYIDKETLRGRNSAATAELIRGLSKANQTVSLLPGIPGASRVVNAD